MILELHARGRVRPAELDRDTFLQSREVGRQTAVAAASALLDGDPGAASEVTGLPVGALTALVLRPPEVPSAGLAAVLGPADALPPTTGVRAAPRWREWAWANAEPVVSPTVLARVAWAIDTLGFLRTEIVRRQRAPWAAVQYVPTHADGAAAAAWGAWPARPWAVRESWDRAYLPW